MSVAALALLPRRDAPYTPVWSTPFFRDTTLNTSVSYVKGRPQAAFLYERVRGKRGAAPSSVPPAIYRELGG